jgi:heparan-alpha-glucosaminide N-acetyltransferase
MIFVNDLAGIKNTAPWLKHMPADADGMTFVDIVFPAFMFIVGISIPLSLGRRLETRGGHFSTVAHILVRTAGLVILGVFMVNMPPKEKLTSMNPDLWCILVFLAAIIVWNQWPKYKGLKQIPYRILRVSGLGALVYLAMIYRNTDEMGNVIGMRHSWWGILGLIGWAYLVAAISFVLLRKRPELMMGVLGVLVILYVADSTGAFQNVPWLTKHIALGGHIGTHGAVTTAGVVVGMLFYPFASLRTPGDRIRWMVMFAIGLTIAGFMLRPGYGISKVNATPSWGLLSCSVCCLLFAGCYWLMDVKNLRLWASPIRPAGENPLLAYILAPVVVHACALMEKNPMSLLPNEGTAGIMRSLGFAAAIVTLTWLLGKIGIRLRM